MLEEVAIKQIESVRDKSEESAQQNTSSTSTASSLCSSSSSSRSTSPSSNVSTTSSSTPTEWEGTGNIPPPVEYEQQSFAESTDGEGEFGPSAERINIYRRPMNGRPDSETDVPAGQSTDSTSSSSAQNPAVDESVDDSQPMDYENGNTGDDQSDQTER